MSHIFSCGASLTISNLTDSQTLRFIYFQRDWRQGVQNYFSKQEMELSKQEMELFLPLPGLWSKNFFYKMFLICSKGFKINFQNRKWNYPNRKWNYFSTFQASDQKVSFTKCFSFDPRDSKLIFKIGKELYKQEMELFLSLPSLWSKISVA